LDDGLCTYLNPQKAFCSASGSQEANGPIVLDYEVAKFLECGSLMPPSLNPIFIGSAQGGSKLPHSKDSP
jgi:hypothetical protein